VTSPNRVVAFKGRIIRHAGVRTMAVTLQVQQLSRGRYVTVKRMRLQFDRTHRMARNLRLRGTRGTVYRLRVAVTATTRTTAATSRYRYFRMAAAS
jgi:hypothetical protein